MCPFSIVNMVKNQITLKDCYLPRHTVHTVGHPVCTHHAATVSCPTVVKRFNPCGHARYSHTI